MANTGINFGGLNEIKSWGWSPTSLARQIDAFRDRTIAGMTPECFGDPDFFGQLLFENELAWKIIYGQPEEILGFWQLIPLTTEGYQRSVAGDICADRIVREIVPRMEPGNWYDAYFFSLSICPKIRKTLVMIQFAGTITRGLLEMARREMYINHLSMCFASNYTMMMNRYFLHFDYCAEHPFAGKIYNTHFPSFLKSPVTRIAMGRNMKQLIQLYREAAPSASEPTV